MVRLVIEDFIAEASCLGLSGKMPDLFCPKSKIKPKHKY